MLRISDEESKRAIKSQVKDTRVNEVQYSYPSRMENVKDEHALGLSIKVGIF